MCPTGYIEDQLNGPCTVRHTNGTHVKTDGESFLQRVSTGVLDVLFPRSCVRCRVYQDCDNTRLCGPCRRKLDLLMAEPSCPRCARRVGPYGIRDGRCPVCHRRRLSVDGMVRVGPYRDELSGLIRAFKYGGCDDLDLSLSKMLAEAMTLAPWFGTIDALLCVPTHWTHSLGRSYYAPRILSCGASRITGIPRATILRRLEGGPHQMEVPPAKRRQNIRGKFAMMRGASVSGARICLIDDVSTTGATLNECGRILKKSGAAAVFGAVICKVDAKPEELTGAPSA